ncbi:hypothetical protein PIN31009_02125 [Pandoraea iniqua]|uniref:hypothetical protein n=1 Tax=Pandoraea iniqua TaxID=2508288 RepID=UPI001240FEF2|nr:hypothetical protein [Pandoraea iniqua]VVE00877.1 hypothetical protein PIN31009_02125 [Pandoraea iniqua]
MKTTYLPRAVWYVALLLLAGMFWLVDWSRVMGSYFPALFSYFACSIFMVVFPSWFYGSRRQPRTTFGIKTLHFWRGAIVLGLIGTVAGLLARSALGAQFGMFLTLWAVDCLLSVREVGFRDDSAAPATRRSVK